MERPQDVLKRQHSREAYHNIFLEADKDRNGYLTLEQFTKLLKQKGYSGKNSDVKKYFKQIDTSGDKKLSESEFLEAMGMIPEAIHNSAFMRMCFYNFDENGDNMIDRMELNQVLHQMGKVLSREQVDLMMKSADKDGSGKLDYEEFIALLYPLQ